MASRASARLSGGGAGDVASKKRPAEELFTQDNKKRKPVKKAFVPKPISQPTDISPSSPPAVSLPPPPSERKDARRRPSMRARHASPDSPPNPSKRQRLAQAPGLHDSLRTELISSAPSAALFGSDGESAPSSSSLPARIDFGAMPSRPRPTLRRAPSPPRHIGATGGRPSMGPPTEPYVRKTRKSMGVGVSLPGESSIGAAGDTLVPLPDSETPMIRKNQALRHDQSRRSSLGLRGQRASSSLGRGDLSIPHRSVDHADFYKHIAPTMPDPIRARHLLVYCSQRAHDMHVDEAKRDKKGKSRSRDKEVAARTEDGDKLVADVMDAFLSGLGKGEIETNVFDNSGPTKGMSLVPHPKNVANRQFTEKAEAFIRKSKEEDAQWSSIKMRSNRYHSETVERINKKQLAQQNDKPDMSDAEAWLTDALGAADDLIAAGVGELAGMGEFADVEFKVDTLNQTTHSALQYSIQAKRFLDGIFSSLAQDLRFNPSSSTPVDADGPDAVSLLSAATAPSAGSSKARDDPINMLRALAAADTRQGNEDAVARARNVAAVSASVSVLAPTGGALGTSIGPGTAAGSGSALGQGAATPRRSAPSRVRGQSTAGPGTAGTGGVRGRMYGRGTQAGAE